MWASERIDSEHKAERFRCGNADLDKWLRVAARDVDRADNARTWVWSDDGEIVAYFALAPHELRREELPRREQKGPAAIPAILLAKLALDERLQGNGLGAQLLIDVLSRAIRAVAQAGGRFLVVDAIDDAARSFYEHHGFSPLPGNSFRLVMRSSDAAASLGQMEE
jgi:GNAT superfamily N-acetyltransferase